MYKTNKCINKGIVDNIVRCNRNSIMAVRDLWLFLINFFFFIRIDMKKKKKYKIYHTLLK